MEPRDGRSGKQPPPAKGGDGGASGGGGGASKGSGGKGAKKGSGGPKKGGDSGGGGGRGGGGGGGGGGRNKGGGKGACTTCGNMGHQARDCPENPATIASKGGGGDWQKVAPKHDKQREAEAQAKRKEEEAARLKKEEEERAAEELKQKRAAERKIKAEEDERQRALNEQKREEDLKRQAAEDELRKKQEAEERAAQRERKVQLRASNLAPKRPPQAFFKTLNVKAAKCGAFPRKLATVTKESYGAILKELDGLNMNQYVEELVAHICEAPLRRQDVFPMVEVCSAIHARYAEFGDALGPAVMASFEQHDPSKLAVDAPEPELIAVVTKRRTALRLLTELFVCGLITEESMLQRCVSDLIKKDPLRKTGQIHNLLMCMSFVRSGAGPILGLNQERKPAGGDSAGAAAAASATTADAEDAEQIETSELVIDADSAKKFRRVFDNYFDGVCEYLGEEYKKMKRSEHHNKDMLKTKGVLSDKAKENYEERRAVFEKLLSVVQQLAEALCRDMPRMMEDVRIDTIEQIGTEVVAKSQLTEQEANSLWPDEEVRSFYEDLADLAERVPGVLLGSAAGGAVEADAESPAPDASAASASGSGAPVLSAAEEAELEAAGREESLDAPKPKTPLDVFMASLLDCTSKRKCDELAEEFVLKHGEKKGRTRLLEALFNCPRNRLELIPRYCRIAATLNQYPLFKELCPALIKKLESQFWYLLKSKNQMTLEGKHRNARFIGEMVNFRIAPADVAFNVLNKTMDDFVHHNVEVAVTLLEVCGRFLYRTPVTHVRMRVALERMLRLKETKALDERLVTAVDNAYYHCNPPEVPAIVRKQRTPVQLFIRHLVFRDMTKVERENTFQSLRRLPWDDLSVEDYLIHTLLKLSRNKFGVIPHLAMIVSQLGVYHSRFLVKLVDALIEELRLGIEDRKGDPQSQIMCMRLLGELFLVHVVDARLLFDVLYTTLMLGVADPNKTEDAFRVRLVCTALECTSKEICSTKSGAQRLEVFTVYLQRYVLALKFVPLDLHFAVNDTLEKVPLKIRKLRSLEEACSVLRQLEGAPEVDEAEQARQRERAASAKEQALSEADKRRAAEDKRRAMLEERRKREEDERKQFDRELAAMMAAPAAPAAGSTRTKGLKMGIPVALLQKSNAVVEINEDGEATAAVVIEEPLVDGGGGESDGGDTDEGEDSDSQEDEEEPPVVADEPKKPAVTFKVLLRKGAKIQAKDLDIPEDNVLAQKVRQRQGEEEREREEMRGLVLQKARLISDSADDDEAFNRNNKGMNFSRKPSKASAKDAQVLPKWGYQ